jgi:hypothetical protein
MAQLTYTKEQYTAKLKGILESKYYSIGKLITSHEIDLKMAQRIYSADDFLKGLDIIGEYLNIDTRDEVYKGLVFMLGVAVLNDLFIDHLNTETA